MFGSTVSKTLTWPKQISRLAHVGIIASVILICVIPIAISATVPAFQQDWYWPPNRAFVWSWMSDWIGQWSSKGLGQPNLLPMETPVVFLQAVLIYIFGPSAGLAAYLFGCAFCAAMGIAGLLNRLKLANSATTVICSLYYALGPVFFIRVQAGHLAYLAAYAALPWILTTASDLCRGNYARWILLSALCAFAYSQIQFTIYVPLALALWGIVYCRSWKAAGLIVLGVFVGAALQLQGLAPLFLSSSRAFYLAEKPLSNWIANLSADPLYAIGGLGYFVPYYARAALPGATALLVSLTAFAAVVSLIKVRRPWVLAVLLFAVGWIVSSGVRGPFGGIVVSAVQTYTPLAVLRDFHYAAIFTALGSSLFIACALHALPPLRYVLLPAVVYAIVPSFGFALTQAGLPQPFLENIKAEAALMSQHGGGPVLWLPAEGPLRFAERPESGRDPAMYTFRNVPFVGDSRDLRIVSQIDNLLHAGSVPVALLRRAGIRYIVTRPDLISSRSDTLGVSAKIGFAGRSIAAIDSMLSHAGGIQRIGTIGRDGIFEVRDTWPQIGVHDGVVGPLQFSSLPNAQVAVLPESVKPLRLSTTTVSPDPRIGWQGPYVGAWFNTWLNDSIYPYVFTDSKKPLQLNAGSGACIAIASPGSVDIRSGSVAHYRSPSWRLFQVRGPLVLQPAGLTAVSGVTGRCGTASRQGTYTVDLSSFDNSWILQTEHGWLRPTLADGWAMGWHGEGSRLVYLPSLAQALSVLLDCIFGICVLLWNRSRVRNNA